MTYPAFFHTPKKIPFMTLSPAYQEYLVRFYYYDNTEETELPATIPIENIENYAAEHLTASHMWESKGFAAARNVDAGDNLDFKNDSEFNTFCIYIAQVFYDFGIANKWFKANISEKAFLKQCYPLGGTDNIPL
jgi:hypothetical protein